MLFFIHLSFEFLDYSAGGGGYSGTFGGAQAGVRSINPKKLFLA